ncbi:helix-turn-helix domain-containing protein [Gordonia sp. NPDC003950]
MAVLLREALGDSLRRVRTQQGRTLREVSTDARVSLGYLSEVERGQKEASSELLASICDALDVEIADLLLEVGTAMRPEPAQSTSADHDAAITPAVVIPAPEVHARATALAAA